MDRIYRLRNAPGLTQEIGYLMQDAQHLANLMHSIEVAARMEAGSTALLQEPLDFCEIVDRVVARHQTIAVQRGVLLAHATPLSAPIDGDPLVVEQVVSNLVHNAITYTPAGGHVSVVVESRSEGGFVLRISDDGPGLDPETFESMFDRGVRGSDAAASHPLGKGLGLSIVRRAVAHHGWRLSHQALDPQGLQVSLWLDDEAKASVDSALGSEVTPSA
jgi:signal transduction histidine kinase